MTNEEREAKIEEFSKRLVEIGSGPGKYDEYEQLTREIKAFEFVETSNGRAQQMRNDRKREIAIEEEVAANRACREANEVLIRERLKDSQSRADDLIDCARFRAQMLAEQTRYYEGMLNLGTRVVTRFVTFLDTLEKLAADRDRG